MVEQLNKFFRKPGSFRSTNITLNKASKTSHHHACALTSSLLKMDQVQISQIAQQFVQSYYQTFDTNRAALLQLYVSRCRRYTYVRYDVSPCLLYIYIYIIFLNMKRPESQLYFEGAHIVGAQAIIEKLMVSF